MPSRQRGHFEVQVGGRKVIERKGGLVAKLLKRPWPSASEVVSAVRAAVGASA